MIDRWSPPVAPETDLITWGRHTRQWLPRPRHSLDGDWWLVMIQGGYMMIMWKLRICHKFWSDARHIHPAFSNRRYTSNAGTQRWGIQLLCLPHDTLTHPSSISSLGEANRFFGYLLGFGHRNSRNCYTFSCIRTLRPGSTGCCWDARFPMVWMVMTHPDMSCGQYECHYAQTVTMK